MKNVSVILRDTTEAGLQAQIDAYLLTGYQMLNSARLILDSLDNEIWYITMQGQIGE
jgi:hypothetical protein